ncbi:MAG: DedA family protein [Patescibacteria group bacterium]
MPPELAFYITKYGYLAIFLLVFLQEIGIPNPVPNELVLLFSGYLSSIGVFNLPLVIFTVVSADFIGTTLLYVVFFYFGKYIFAHKPRWFPFPLEKVESIAKKISSKGRWGIYLGRLVPYLRGYTSIAAGLIQIKPSIYLLAVLASAITWSGGYVVAGKILGPYYENFAKNFGVVQSIILLVLVFVIGIIVVRRFIKKWHKKTN